MDPHMLESPMRRMTSDALSVGLTDSFCGTSPRSLPTTPESFVVTPEGRTLPAVREIHIDSEGRLLVVDRPAPIPQALLPDYESPIKREVPLVRMENSPFADIPIDCMQTLSSPPLQLQWEPQQLLTWNRAQEDPEPSKRTVSIIQMDSQGVGHLIEVRLREYQRSFQSTDDEGQFIVEKDGTVHLAHRVFINTGEQTEVVIREDELQSGVFDDVPTPTITLGPDSDIVFISDLKTGSMHFGTPCFVSCLQGRGETMMFYRVALFPTLFNPRAFRKALTYNAPLLIRAKPPAADTCKGIAFVDNEGRLQEFYDRILLADSKGGNDKIIVGYQARHGGGRCLVSEGGHDAKVVSLTGLPPHSKFSDCVFICAKHGQCYVGANVMVAAPEGLIPVARLVELGGDDVLVKTEVSCGFAVVPGLMPIAGLPTGLCPHLLLTSRPVLLLKDRPKNAHYAKTSLNPVKVFICNCDGPLYPTLYPAPCETYEGVLVAGGEQVHKGHSVIKLSTKKGGPSEVRFVPNTPLQARQC
eukprot:TRINITY_DN24354_c0_g1_i2.p2 TRINITY_DN24354_c0_g1~~TRINITY_DN24354_c0_g1_i2.p2  ORF type:complete len:602 (+),score=228.77 TRINITY_DN24354_c0_g1_i2:228-1808(+)